MNDKYLDDLIRYRLDRAYETYEEAILMQREKHWNTCANRLYYACFYAVIALLEKYGYTASKHGAVKSLFNRHFIKTSKISKELGKLFNSLFDARQESDYIDFVYFEEKTIKPWIPKVKEFISTISSQLEIKNL